MDIKEKFIRACRSLEPMDSVVEIYSTDYLWFGDPYPYLVSILSEIVDEYQLITSSRLVIELSPEKDWMYVEKGNEGTPNWYYKCTRILVSTIRLSESRKFGDIFTKDTGSVLVGIASSIAA